MSRGKDFERELKASMENAGWYAMRIADKLYWTGTRIASEETPADFIAYAISDGNIVPLMVECKATAQKSIAFDAVQPHQLEALRSFRAFHDSCRSFVAVNFYDGNNIRNRNLCYMIPIAVWERYIAESGKKSINIDQCNADESIVSCPRVKGQMFDLRSVLL